MAGPDAATLLGHMGAGAVKLRPPNGDRRGRIRPRRGSDSGVFVGDNRNNRSVAVDLRAADGQEVLDRLVRWADVVVDNLRPKARLALGLDYESLRARNPGVVSVSVSTFGSTGPYA